MKNDIKQIIIYVFSFYSATVIIVSALVGALWTVYKLAKLLGMI